MVRTILGTGTTDENGLVDFLYTGRGIGEVDITAEATVDGSSFVSETYELLDASFYDCATSTNYNTNWTNQNNSLEVTRDANGTTLTPTSLDTYNRYIIPSGSIPSTPFALEFDKLSTTTNNNQLLVCGGVIYPYSSWNGALSGNCHIKLEVDTNNKITCIVDGVTQSTLYDSSGNGIRFQFQNTNGSAEALKYANLKVYPI